MDELFNPSYYPYLFKVNIGGRVSKQPKGNCISEFTPEEMEPAEENTVKEVVSRINPNDGGIFNNFKLFLKQSLVSQLIVS